MELFEVVQADYIYGVSSAIIIALFSKLVSWIRFQIRNRSQYSVQGFWISEYRSVFNRGVLAIDILHITLHKNKLFIKYQQYCNNTPVIHNWKGEGHISSASERISISYLYDDHNASKNGVMLLTPEDVKSIQKILVGKFYEFDSRVGDGIHGQTLLKGSSKIFPMDYCAYKIKLSVKERIAFLFNKKVCPTYMEAKKRLDGAKNVY